MTAAGPSGCGGPAPGAVEPPSGMQIVGALVRAFDATKDAPAGAACVLRSRTSQRGFKGECKTVRWCCPLSAFCDFLLDRKLVTAPELPTDANEPERFALFMPLATELIAWDQLRERAQADNVCAHFRYVTATAAHRVGILLGTARGQVPPYLQAGGSWLDPSWPSELLRNLLKVAQKNQDHFARNVGYDADTIGRWIAGGRPNAEAFQHIGGYFARVLPGMPGDALARWLRWHYALRDLVDAAAGCLGQEVVSEAAKLFTEIVNCTARSSRSKAEESSKVAVLAGWIAPHAYDFASDVAGHLARHGATNEFIDDFESAAAAWRAVFQAHAGDMPSQAALLMKHLPRAAHR